MTDAPNLTKRGFLSLLLGGGALMAGLEDAEAKRRRHRRHKHKHHTAKAHSPEHHAETHPTQHAKAPHHETTQQGRPGLRRRRRRPRRGRIM